MQGVNMSDKVHIKNPIKGALKEQKNLAKLDNTAWKKDYNKLLNPDMLRNLDFESINRTNKVGAVFTADDLVNFKRRIDKLGKKYKGGIKPKQLINQALKIDRERATKEIGWAVISGYNNSVFRFVTKSSGKYKETRHFVNVEFTEFASIVAKPIDDNKAVEMLKNSYVKFDCDCGRHRYWYRYVASIGKFAYVGKSPIGRAETAYPKIRNPNLSGVACKHVLRVMHSILYDKNVNDTLQKAVNGIRKGKSNKKISNKQAESNIKNMLKNNQGVLSSSEKFFSKSIFKTVKKFTHKMGLNKNINLTKVASIKKTKTLKDKILDRLKREFSFKF